MAKYSLTISFETETPNKTVKDKSFGLHDKYGASFKPLVKPNLPKSPTVTATTASIIPKKNL